MKKYLLLFFIFLVGCSKITYTDNQKVVENNTITFIKNKVSTALLIASDNKNTLVILENKDKIYTNSLENSINNLVLLNDTITDIEYEYKYKLDNAIMLDDLKIARTDKVLIELNNYKFCVYDKSISINGDYSMCDFIYILNNEEDVYIKLNNDMKVLFYNEYVDFSAKFLEHLYTTWIDTYIITSSEFTKLNLEGKEYRIEGIKSKI